MSTCGICGEELKETGAFSMGGHWACPKGHFERFQNYHCAMWTIGDEKCSTNDEGYRERLNELCRSHPDYDEEKMSLLMKEYIAESIRFWSDIFDRNYETIKDQLSGCPDYRFAQRPGNSFVLQTFGNKSEFPDSLSVDDSRGMPMTIGMTIDNTFLEQS